MGLKEMADTDSSKAVKSKDKLTRVEKQVILLFGVLFLVFIGFLATVKSISSSSEPESFQYKNFTIYKSKMGTLIDFYIINIQVKGGDTANIIFRYDPREVEEISLDLGPESLNKIRKVWLTFYPYANDNSSATLAAGEIGRFTSAVAIDTDYGLTTPRENFPHITCEDDSKIRTRVIEIRQGNETRVFSEGNCIFVEGETYEDMIRAADRLAYYWLEWLFISPLEKE